jgi:HlyD family secretion protein
VTQAEANLKFQESQTSNQVAQAEANLASAQAQIIQAAAALENARLNFERQESLHKTGAESQQAYDQARTAYDGARAASEASDKQARAAQAAVALAKSNSEQTAARAAAFEASRHQLAAAGAQKQKAEVQLGYTEIRSPLNAIVDTRAALPGEVVNPGQAIVTLINQDDLWIRADVEESYIDRVHLGDRLQVKLPSGAAREGLVFFRGVDADYATQRDVSRTKRDIKTFEIRLRCDNRDRSLAVGMTAYVTLPPATKAPATKP